MKKFKKSLIVMYCLCAFCATGQPLHDSEGVFMKEIKLSEGKKGYPEPKHKGKYVALVSDEDFDYLNQFNWSLMFGESGSIYAYRQEWRVRKYIYMHREVMQATASNILVDHKDRNGLNNTRDNLRIATPSQNNANRKSLPTSSSKYLGVSKVREKDKWQVHIMKWNISKFLGYFKTEEEAARAYDEAAKFVHGEFANLNFKS